MNILILLIGGNPIANYALIEYFKNNGDNKIPKYDSVMLVFTEKTSNLANNIKSLQKNINFIEINLSNNESNLDYIQTIILDKLNELKNLKSIHLNYTGGRKPMSLGSYLAVDKYKKRCQKIYTDINPANYKLTLSDGKAFLDGNNTISSKLNISIDDFYTLHKSYKPANKQIENSEFYSKEFCQFLLEKCDKNEKEFYIDLWDKSDIKRLNWKNSIKNIYKIDDISNNKLKKLQKFIKGIWLEEYLFDILNEIKDEVNITDLAWNIEYKQEKDEFELDVIAIKGYKSFVFSCTTDKKANIKQKGFEVAQRAEQIAGRGSSSFLISLANSDGIDKVMRDLSNRDKIFEAIGIEDIKDIENFKSKLKNMII